MAEKWYQCHQCGAIFVTQDALKDHRDTCTGANAGNHGGSGSEASPEYVCGTCGQVFSSQTALGAHAFGCHANLPTP